MLIHLQTLSRIYGSEPTQTFDTVPSTDTCMFLSLVASGEEQHRADAKIRIPEWQDEEVDWDG